LKTERRHELKEDQVASHLSRLWQWILLHRAKVVAVVVALALLAAAIGWSSSAMAAARNEAAFRLAELERNLGVLETARGQGDAKAAELSQAALAEARQLAADESGAVGARALLCAGRLLFDDKKYEESAKTFREAVARSSSWPALLEMARRSLAAALEEAGQSAQALAEYEKLGPGVSAMERARHFWDIGRCREELGDLHKAREAYDAAAEAAAESPWGQLARARSQELSAPKPAAKPAAPAAPAQLTPGAGNDTNAPLAPAKEEPAAK